MKRSMAWPAALLSCALVVAGCSSSGSSKTSTTPGPTDAPTPTTPAPPITPTACSFLTAAQVKALLGATPAGQESDLQNTNKACTWTGGGSASRPNTLSLGVIRIGNGEVGFGGSVQGFTSTDLKGLGRKATYAVGKSSLTGLNGAVLTASKGTVSVSVTLKYAGTLPGLQQQMTEIVKSVYKKLNVK